MAEADALQALAAPESGRPVYSPASPVQFKAGDHVFVERALDVDFTYRSTYVTLPPFRRRGTTRALCAVRARNAASSRAHSIVAYHA
jgi:hypothetical protein